MKKYIYPIHAGNRIQNGDVETHLRFVFGYDSPASIGNFDFYISRICGDLTSTACYGFRHIDVTGVGSTQEHLFRKKCSGNITRIGFHKNFRGIRTFKFYVPRASLNGELPGGDHVF